VIARSDAAALIPEETSNEIIQAMPTVSAALTLFRHMTMSRKQKRLPVLAALPYAYFVSGDTGLKRTTSMEWENRYLEAEELACIVPIPEAVLDDSEFDIWGEIRPRIAEAMGAKLDGAVFFGIDKPATWASSVVQGAAAAGNTFVRGSVAGQKLDLDINAVMSLVEDDDYDVNGFAARKSIKGGLRGLRTNDGALLFQPSLQAGTPDTLYGERIFYAQNEGWDEDEADLIAGDYTKGIIGIRQDITYKLLTEAAITDPQGNIIFNLAQQDMVALRIVFRCAWQTANPASRRRPNAANRSPFSVLRPVGYGS
jgi:HK97 family phage major capsid protein